jgi:hypothetical protein
MTKDEALKLAREAGFVTLSINEDKWGPYLERFAELVRADERDKWMERTAILIRGEREACAKVCDEFSDVGYVDKKLKADYHAYLIRQRGQA